MTVVAAMKTIRPTFAALLLAIVIAGCRTAGGSAPSPSPSPSPMTSPVASPDEAAARVIDAYPQFRGLRPFDPGVIGLAAFYRAEATDGGFRVIIQVGWGDCPAGCIDNHRWSFDVTRDGTVTLVAEEGPAVPAEVWQGLGLGSE